MSVSVEKISNTLKTSLSTALSSFNSFFKGFSDNEKKIFYGGAFVCFAFYLTQKMSGKYHSKKSENLASIAKKNSDNSLSFGPFQNNSSVQSQSQLKKKDSSTNNNSGKEIQSISTRSGSKISQKINSNSNL